MTEKMPAETPARPKPVLRRRLRALVLALVAVALLAWAFRGAAWDETWAVLRAARWEFVPLSLLLMLAALAVRARRWGTLLAVSQPAGNFRARFSAVLIAMAMNGFLPGSVSELARAMVLRHSAGVPATRALGGVVAERIFDLAIVVGLILTPWLVAGANAAAGGSLLLTVTWLALGVALTGLGLFAMARWPGRVLAMVDWLVPRVGLGRISVRIRGTAVGLLEGLEGLRHPKVCLHALLDTVVMWLLISLAHLASLAAVGASGIGLDGAMHLAGVMAVAIVLPISAGAIGPLEAAVRLALEGYGIGVASVIAFVVLQRAMLYLVTVPIGMFCLARLGLTLRQLMPHPPAAAVEKRAIEEAVRS